jgi:DNA-binding HxlR family transcriptional regulator
MIAQKLIARKLKLDIQQLNKAFDNRIRLGIMSILMVNDAVDFGSMKETLNITDGNLASHMSALEKHEYVEIKKQFIGKKPNTSYSVTKLGKKAFGAHLDALEKILKNSK